MRDPGRWCVAVALVLATAAGARGQEPVDLSGEWRAQDGSVVWIVHRGTSVRATFRSEPTCPFGGARGYYLAGTLQGSALRGRIVLCTEARPLVQDCGLDSVWESTFEAAVADATRITGEYRGERWVPGKVEAGRWVACRLEQHTRASLSLTRLGQAPRGASWLEVLMDATTLVVTFGLLAFMVERLTNGIAIVLGYWSWWRERMEGPATADADTRARTDRNRRVALFGLSALLGVAGALLIGLNFLGGVPGLPRVPVPASYIVTGLLIAAGADPIRELLRLREGGRGAPPPAQPIQVTGNLIVQQVPAAPPGKAEQGG